jgi:uncharacterized protein
MLAMPSPKPTLLFVDGYNVIGAHPTLQDIRDGHGLEEARRQLIELVVNYSAIANYETEIVFDAYNQASQVSREPLTERVCSVYTDFQQTADSYIEWACAQFFRHDLRRFDQSLVVATSDRAQWLTAVGYGAEWMSSLKLVNLALGTAQKTRQLRHAKKTTQRFLASGLDDEVQQRLARLRQALLDQGE